LMRQAGRVSGIEMTPRQKRQPILYGHRTASKTTNHPNHYES
jgi:hypothetical protein